MTHVGLFRVLTSVLHDRSASPAAIAASVERIGDKPLSDGLEHRCRRQHLHNRRGKWGRCEHGPRRIAADAGEERQDEMGGWHLLWGRWTYYYFTDGAIPDQMLQSRTHIEASAPYAYTGLRPRLKGYRADNITDRPRVGA